MFSHITEGCTDLARASAFYDAILQPGNHEGAPGDRPWYGKGYYGAYLRDPDGNKLHVVHRGDLERSW